MFCWKYIFNPLPNRYDLSSIVIDPHAESLLLMREILKSPLAGSGFKTISWPWDQFHGSQRLDGACYSNFPKNIICQKNRILAFFAAFAWLPQTMPKRFSSSLMQGGRWGVEIFY
jgi:hypothetical protein